MIRTFIHRDSIQGGGGGNRICAYIEGRQEGGGFVFYLYFYFSFPFSLVVQVVVLLLSLNVCAI